MNIHDFLEVCFCFSTPHPPKNKESVSKLPKKRGPQVIEGFFLRKLHFFLELQSQALYFQWMFQVISNHFLCEDLVHHQIPQSSKDLLRFGVWMVCFWGPPVIPSHDSVFGSHPGIDSQAFNFNGSGQIIIFDQPRFP